MVSIDSRIIYKERIQSSAKLMAFDHFLHGIDVAAISYVNTSDSDQQFIAILSAIQTSNKTAFDEIYNTKSKSNPSRESPAPFVNDDYLIFSLIIAIKKFGIDTVWIKKILSLRNRNTVTITLENIVNENYSSTSNQAEIVLMFLQQHNKSLITNQTLNTAFKSIMNDISLFENRNDFLILSALRAYELIIELKEAREGSEIQLLQRFNKIFIKRTKLISWFLQAGLLSAVVYGLLKLPVYSPNTVKKINDYGFVFTLIGATGITLLSNQLNFIKQKSHEYTMRLLGYPKEMFKKLQ
jgi:xanthosine utilization system XapX-like protein